MSWTVTRLFVCHAASSVARRSGDDGKPGLSPSNGPPATRTSPARCTLLRSAHEPSRPRTRPEYPVGSSPHESETCPRWRSEEHTSELQSQSNLVCRLLLEKKKT